MNTENKSFTPTDIKDLWQTPKYVFDYFDRQYGFTHDVAAADDNHLCQTYFTKEGNGLAQEWGDVNWCNPPYSNIQPWVDKAIEESGKGRITVMLIPSDSSVQWFKSAYYGCTEGFLINGRLAFVRADTKKAVPGNNKGSVVFIFGDGELPGDNPNKLSLVERDLMKAA